MKASRKKHRRFPPRSGASTERVAQRVRVELTGFDQYGAAIGRDEDGAAVVAAYGIPGESVVVEVREESPEYALGEVVEVLEPSDDRVEPRCAHFGTCGGCQLQHVDYPAQTRLKTDIVRDQLRTVGGLVDAPVSPMVAADSPWNYRNHARFTVRRGGMTGFTHWLTHKFEPIEECHIMDSRINAVRAELDGKMGKARQLGVRFGTNTSSHLIHPKLDPEDSGGLETGQTGHDERLAGVRFRVSAASFFQVNTRQAERMAGLVRDGLHLGGTDVLLDAYAGVGTFAALFAPLCSKVIAVEESASAIRDAKENVGDLPNVEVIEAKTEDFLEGFRTKPDAVILDPPRSGCDRRVIKWVGRVKPPRVVYVSCEPATLARDLRLLVLSGYRVVDVTPLDMFPQTYHIECVATLELATEPLVLASTSPRRVQLVREMAVAAQAIAPEADEPAPRPHDDPHDYARSLAEAKARSIAVDALVPVLGADTVVIAPGGRILGKPVDDDDAREMLRRLRDREHSVVTGVAVIQPGRKEVVSDSLRTRVWMRDFTDEEIDAYVASGTALDRAGAYGIQDDSFAPVSRLAGCRPNVVGLPLCLTSRLLARTDALPAFAAVALPEFAADESQLSGRGDCRYCRPPQLR